MKKLIYSAVVALILASMIASTVTASYGVWPKIIAGQNEWVGNINVAGSHSGIAFSFVTYDGHCITDAAIHIGLSLDDFPQNNGGAIPGQFDYHYDFGGCVTEATVIIQDPVGEWGQQLYLAVHTNIRHPDGQEDTGWAVICGQLYATQFYGKNWSGWFILPADAWFDV